jgi:hypothetical protein
MSLENGAYDGGVAGRLLGHASTERAEKDGHGLVGLARFFHRRLELFELHLAKDEQDVVLAREVIEESAFADVSGIGDVFNGGLNKAFPGKEIESSAEETLAELGAAALAAVRGSARLCLPRAESRNGASGHSDYHSRMTIGHLESHVKHRVAPPNKDRREAACGNARRREQGKEHPDSAAGCSGPP